MCILRVHAHVHVHVHAHVHPHVHANLHLHMQKHMHMHVHPGSLMSHALELFDGRTLYAEHLVNEWEDTCDVSEYRTAVMCGRLAQMGAYATTPGNWKHEWEELDDNKGHVYCLYRKRSLPLQSSRRGTRKQT